MNQENVDLIPANMPDIQWMGDPIALMPPAEAILAADDREFGVGEQSRALEFYEGEQWPAEIKHKRESEGRPCLVLNKLPILVAAALDASRKTGSSYFKRTPDQEQFSGSAVSTGAPEGFDRSAQHGCPGGLQLHVQRNG